MIIEVILIGYGIANAIDYCSSSEYGAKPPFVTS
jgi:hypothetical protein